MTTRRLTSWFDPMGYEIVEKEQRPDAAAWGTPAEVYDLKDVWTTRDGEWDTSDKEGSVPDWARADYIAYWASQGQYYYPSIGGATHMFMMVLDQAGNPMPGKQHWYWNGGVDKLVAPNYPNMGIWQRLTGEAPSGFSNMDIGPHESGYTPPNKGPWFQSPFGLADVLCYVGRYKGYHISTFAVWQARKPGSTPPPTPPPPGNEGEIMAALQSLTSEVQSLHADLRALAAHLGKTL